MLLQHLKVIFLIGGMLVDHEDISVKFGDDKSKVELTDDLHLFKHILTGRMEVESFVAVKTTKRHH